MPGPEDEAGPFRYRDRVRRTVNDVNVPIASDSFVLTTSRFNLPYVRELIEGRAERHRLGVWTEVARPGWLMREISVTVHGSAEGIAGTRSAVGFADEVPAR